MSPVSAALALRQSGEAARRVEPGAGRDVDPVQPCPHRRTWIELKVEWAGGAPAGGVAWRIVDPRGAEHRGRTDAEGVGRLEPVAVGACAVSLPEIEPGADGGGGDDAYVAGTSRSCEAGRRHRLRLGEWDLTTIDAADDGEADEEVDGEAGEADGEEPSGDWDLTVLEAPVDDDD
ncbi:MAG: hypothetical protein JWM10_5164 [Myxococcaceae bacterium]|nr:hypothetical protein [Myxococcaceae bacterium]